jgi:phytol kinase
LGVGGIDLEAINGFRAAGFVLVVVAVWLVTGGLKAAGRLPCDIARKINHVMALAGAAVWFGWLPETQARASVYLVCGILLALVILVCAFRDRVPFRYAFLANTRRSDFPHEAFYFWSSWLVSITGLLVMDLLLCDIVATRTAALLVGIGDAVGEPIGRRWGKHRYRVPTLTAGQRAERSLEGSAAVFAGCFLTLLFCFGTSVIVAVVALAAVLTIVEAVSPHGLDNLTIPVVSALCLHQMMACKVLMPA